MTAPLLPDFEDDNYFFTGLDDERWFGRHFQPYLLLGYIGDRKRLQAELEKKSIVRRLVEILAPRLNVGALFKLFTGFNLLGARPGQSIADDMIKLLNERENQRRLVQLMESIYESNRKRGAFFDRVGRESLGRRPLGRGDFNQLKDTLITVEGQLVHRSVVAQYSPTLNAVLRSSKGEWLLADLPPPGLVDANARFKGDVLLLREEEGFTAAFREHLPFCPDIGWYPYVRITGFFDTSLIVTELLPSLSLCLIEYRRPKLFSEERTTCVDFYTRELGETRNYLSRTSDYLLSSYLPPLLFRGSNLRPNEADSALSSLWRTYLQEPKLPQALRPFYEKLPGAAP